MIARIIGADKSPRTNGGAGETRMSQEAIYSQLTGPVCNQFCCCWNRLDALHVLTRSRTIQAIKLDCVWNMKFHPFLCYFYICTVHFRSLCESVYKNKSMNLHYCVYCERELALCVVIPEITHISINFWNALFKRTLFFQNVQGACDTRAVNQAQPPLPGWFARPWINTRQT